MYPRLVYSSLALSVLLAPVRTQPAKNSGLSYEFPDPLVEVFEPRGFRISIPDEHGIKLFAFNGNVNKPIHVFEAGQLSGDTKKKRNGRWAFEEPQLVLHPGDYISYWLYVTKDGLGYRYENGHYLVTGTKPCSEGTLQEVTTTPLPPVSVAAPFTVRNEEMIMCQTVIINMTSVVFNLEEEIRAVREDNEILSEALERFPGYKKLTLNGRLPPSEDGEDISSVSFILREKLGINPSVLSVEKNADGSLTFELSTLREKIDVLKASKQLLGNSKYKIT